MIDVAQSWPVVRHRVVGQGRVMNFVEDEITTPQGETIIRQWCTHPGAVAIIAWSADDKIKIVHQYRHPVQMKLVEPPAGLLDVAGEDPLLAAQRELAEEAMLSAKNWRVLVDIFTSPGGVQEAIRVYLATDLQPVPRPEGFVVEGEEADMGQGWIDREELVDAIFAGKIQSPTMVDGVLALQTALLSGRLKQLRSADSPWPARQDKLTEDVNH